MNWIALIIQLVSGAVGGHLAGGAMKNMNLSMIVRTVAGAIGGVGGGQLAGMLMTGGTAAAASGMDIGAIITQILSGGVGGAVLTAIAGMVMKSSKT